MESEAWNHLSGTFEPKDLAPQLGNVIATVHVQAEMDHARDPVEETLWLQSLRQEEMAHVIPTVAVGYADLTSPDVGDVLDRHAEFDFFQGIRQEAWHDASAPTSVIEHDIDLLRHPNWTNGLKELAQRNLTFDLLVYAHQLRLAADTFSHVPELAVVVDHLGASWICR